MTKITKLFVLLAGLILGYLLIQVQSNDTSNFQGNLPQTVMARPWSALAITQLPSPVLPETNSTESEPTHLKGQVELSTVSLSNGCRLVSNYDWNVRIAYAICMAESGGNPRAYHVNSNGSVDRGLMQVNSIHRDMVSTLDSLYEPHTNLSVAYRIYQGRGWSAWSSYKSGIYTRFLK